MTGSSLEAIATATGSKVEQATDVTPANPVLAGGVGQEPRVVGNAFISYKQIIIPIEGTTGIYVVKNVSTTKALQLKILRHM
jgi:peptidyl-prolyl cis-trans isomerase D